MATSTLQPPHTNCAFPCPASTSSTANTSALAPNAAPTLGLQAFPAVTIIPLGRSQALDLLTKLLSSKPPSSYSAAASELHRRLNFSTDRASVRRWAIQNNLAPDSRFKAPPKPVKRWQARDYGALWQYDASPHPWLPGKPGQTSPPRHPGRRHPPQHRRAPLSPRNPPGPLGFPLPRLSQPMACRWPSMWTSTPSSSPTTPTLSPNSAPPCTSMASPCATPPLPKPKAKSNAATTTGKNACPRSWPLMTSWTWKMPTAYLTNSCLHANQHEIHRELGTTPQAARTQALAHNRSVLRPAPACPWWPYVWSQQTRVRVGDDGTVPSAPNANPLTPRPAPKSSAACVQTGTSTISAMPPIQRPNLSFYSIALSSKKLSF